MDVSALQLFLSTCDIDNHTSVAQAAIALARQIQQRAHALQTPAEKRQQAELHRMIQFPQDKATLTQLTDQAFRSESASRSADQLTHILDVQGIPRFFSPLDRALLRGFQSFGAYLPGVAVPLVKEKMRHETANVILPAERELLCNHLRERISEGVRMNVNFLGEAILGERESFHRLQTYKSAYELSEIECMSVKISTLYSQISPIAPEATIQIVSDRLQELYSVAQRNKFKRKDGSTVSKFVYLDMEEYRDMHLTKEVFMRTLDRKGMEQVRAGIALQAYIPDSFIVQQELTEWAERRVADGKAPITIRIVKGANMEMERVEASIRGWPQAPFQTKIETDANYKRMLVYGLHPERINAVRLGIASHNLFEIAFAILISAKLGIREHVQFEMLEGMANHQRRALREIVDQLLLYAPACRQQDFVSAIGYLVRRMDENTGPDNFLRHAFQIEVDSHEWKRLEQIFLESVNSMKSVSCTPRRTQDRNLPAISPKPTLSWQSYDNEPDTDFALRNNVQWARTIIAKWSTRCDANATTIDCAIAGHDQQGSGTLTESFDPSRPGVVAARYHQASPLQIQQALDCAVDDKLAWRFMSPQERYKTMRQVAQNIRERRGDLIGAAIADGGKTFIESDAEVSEAIDFVEFYSVCAKEIQSDAQIRAKPKGTVVVVSPWNFPIAIPCGGVAAALSVGNTVILKPASDTVLPARILCECFWDAGVSREALQLVMCSGHDAGQYLLSDSRIDCVILTGGTETAQRILAKRPELQLLAETGGKNATIVSNLSDRDLAIKNILHSAFSHSGQKCSATSLLLLHEEVYHDSRFRDALVDAVSSLSVGSAWETKSKLGPLIRPPEGVLLRALQQLEPGEEWAVQPKQLENNPCLYSPGIKWNVSRGGFTHKTELFGPLLAVMPYRDLDEAIDIQHETGYGLTSGLESLDDREREQWSKRIKAGNLYINRPTTGAIVLRQPFGGMGKSAFGPGIKAGGPNYVVPLLKYKSLTDSISSDQTYSMIPHLKSLHRLWLNLIGSNDIGTQVFKQHLKDNQWNALLRSISDYDRVARLEIRQTHDTVKLLGQDNFRRYQPVSKLRIRIEETDSLLDILLRMAAVLAVGGKAVLSHVANVRSSYLEILRSLFHQLPSDVELIEESDEQLIHLIHSGDVERLRYSGLSEVAAEIRKAANEQFAYIADTPICEFGRIELLWYVREQSLCIDYHRYGNLGRRIEEIRREVS